MASDISKDGFEGTWPDIERRLRRVLARKSIPPWLKDDIVQETGLRLFRNWNRIDPERGPWPLAMTIANNLLWDETHRRQPREVLGTVPERPDGHDVERAGLARLELLRIKRVLPLLSHNYRSVLLSEIGYRTQLRGSPRAINMLRMRARQRLAALLDKTASSVITLPPVIRSAATRLLAPFRRHPATGDATAAVTVALLATTAAILGGGSLVPDVAPNLDEPRSHVASPLAIGSGQAPDPLGQEAITPLRRAEAVAEHAKRTAQDVKDKADKLAETKIADGGPAEAHVDVGFDNEGSGTATEVPQCQVDTEESGARASCRGKLSGHALSLRAGARVNDHP